MNMKINKRDFQLLVVDDEPLIRESLYEILRIEGYRVQMASTAEEALEIMLKDTIDIVVTDFKLPKMNGLELLQIIKENKILYRIYIEILASISFIKSKQKLGRYDEEYFDSKY